MLTLIFPESEEYDEAKNLFVNKKQVTINLEHSLVSLSKWESKWCKPFLSNGNKTYEETIDYVKCMTITQNVAPETYDRITPDMINQVNEYISAPMTATWFTDRTQASGGKPRQSHQVITSELIYYWMIALEIPFECQKWHLNRLLTLIRVCNDKNDPKKNKMSKRDIYKQNSSLNAARRAAMNTKG